LEGRQTGKSSTNGKGVEGENDYKNFGGQKGEERPKGRSTQTKKKKRVNHHSKEKPALRGCKDQIQARLWNGGREGKKRQENIKEKGGKVRLGARSVPREASYWEVVRKTGLTKTSRGKLGWKKDGSIEARAREVKMRGGKGVKQQGDTGRK